MDDTISAMPPEPIKAIELFSGIGAFAHACKLRNIEVVAAFDQGQDANQVYEHNFSKKPSARNLDSISADEIPNADIWWMSPPCTPYTVRGTQRDEQDSRSLSLRNLLDVLSDKLPSIVFVENVLAFECSRMYRRLHARFEELNYDVTTVRLCPTQFGIPMKRPRVFVCASRKGGALRVIATAPPSEVDISRLSLRTFLQKPAARELAVEANIVEKYADGLNIIDPADESAYAICFTSGYGKSLRSSGSLLRSNGVVRRFSAPEILSLLGFGKDFAFPPGMPLQTQLRLVGNSVDVRCIRHLLDSVEATENVVRRLPELRNVE